MHPKVSVVMASYNHAAFVRESVESVLSQSFGDLELVITDDGSSDATADVIRGIKDSRIDFVVYPENHGTCDAINDSILRSHAQYLAVLSSDDFFLPEKIARQVEFLDSHPEVGAVFGLPRVVDESSRALTGGSHPFTTVFAKTNRGRVEWLRHFFEFGNCLCHPTMMIRRKCYDQVGLYNRLLLNLPDFDMWIRLCQVFDIHVLAEQLTAFRVLRNDRNTSAPSRANLARAAWEVTQVLGHFAQLPESQLHEMVAPWAEKQDQQPAITLALAALRIDRPGYSQFALRLLHEAIARKRDAYSIKEYFRLVGQKDPHGAGLAIDAAEAAHLRGFSTLHELLDRSEAWCRRSLLGRGR